MVGFTRKDIDASYRGITDLPAIATNAHANNPNIIRPFGEMSMLSIAELSWVVSASRERKYLSAICSFKST